MASVTMSITGLPELMAAIQAATQEQAARIDARIQEAGTNTQADAQQNAPVLTGELRDGTEYIPGNYECWVVNNVPYAGFVNNGHFTRNHVSYVAANPFMTNAFIRERARLVPDLEAMVV